MEKDAILFLRSGGVSHLAYPSASHLSLLTLQLTRLGTRDEEELGAGGILPVGEALWQEGICGHRVYLILFFSHLTVWVGL